MRSLLSMRLRLLSVSARNLSYDIKPPLVTLASRHALNLKNIGAQRKETYLVRVTSELVSQSPASISRITRQMSTSTENLVVQHDPKSRKFYITLGEGEAKLEYTKKGDTLNMWHTEVPPVLQGRGIAKVLAKEAFEHVAKNNLKMILTCPYLQKYNRENTNDQYKQYIVT